MEKVLNKIDLHYRDPMITKGSESESRAPDYTRAFNQGEEFFLQLADNFTIPAIPIHHDVDIKIPPAPYKAFLSRVMEQVIPLAPRIFQGLTYFFDPAEILRPCFYQIFKVQGKTYLYLLRMDLAYRTNQGTILRQGTNDLTQEFSTNMLFLEADFIPLSEIVLDSRPPAFLVEQSISQTWIGQRGKGYNVQGIWIDMELTKFFTKLFLPQGKRAYPYYPFTCKYKTICHTPMDLSPRGRKRHLPYLIHIYNFLQPRLESILTALKKEDFSVEMEIFRQIKNEVPPSWTEIWKNLTVTPYLNSFDMKEFRVDFQ